MKKKLKIIIAIILLVPVKECLKDGGTIKYNAVLWGVTKEHSMTRDSAGNHGYSTGIIVRILWFDVYKDLEFTPHQKGA
ncbi:MAG: hypothetical protein K2J32_05125 [Ruminococcus sp.]|nr:hypothetical protein [Ruminococcus sp.]